MTALITVAFLVAAGLPPRPRFPPVFDSEWLRYETFVDGIGSQGPCKWASNSKAMYVNMTDIKTEQLVIGNTFYQWFRETKKCTSSKYPFDLLEHWFDNTTFSGYTEDGAAIWVGSLAQDGQLSNYVVYSNTTTGYFGPKYIAANIYRDADDRPGSEINDLKRITYHLPSGSDPWFEIPEFCK
eukprot:TRINITY_DN10772_c0_g1_i1.p1 TRINITY_DN10772_c0_g1~~TRINITY_DN10772_c0_g1_i1.p1  ORF type:complete len:183 (+),score=29.67 TRINITY_DN10772_c0_g1_i1:148-696(+)